MKENQAKETQTLTTDVDLQTKSRWMAFLLGIFIGLAVIVPGVSGSTIAIIFGLYTSLLYAIGNIFNNFKRCVLFLIPIALGAAVGFLTGFLMIQKVFGAYLFLVICLFVGLMAGALPAVLREIRGAKRSPRRVLLFTVGCLIPILIAVLSVILGKNGESTETFTSFPVMRYVLYFPLGFVVSATQIIPGLSATALLLAFGQFGPILNSLHLDYILENPQVLLLYASIGFGFLAGLVLISRVFSIVLSKYKTTAFFMICGMSVGSIASMFVNSDVVEVYTAWAAGQRNAVTELVIGAILLAAGFTVSFLLTRYELNRNQ